MFWDNICIEHESNSDRNKNLSINECLDKIKSKWKKETQMRGSDFIIYCVNLIYHKYHKISFKRASSYIDSLDWIEKKKKQQ